MNTEILAYLALCGVPAIAGIALLALSVYDAAQDRQREEKLRAVMRSLPDNSERPALTPGAQAQLYAERWRQVELEVTRLVEEESEEDQEDHEEEETEDSYEVDDGPRFIYSGYGPSYFALQPPAPASGVCRYCRQDRPPKGPCPHCGAPPK